MHAIKMAVAAAAALMVGATSAQTMHDSSTISATHSHPWATGELWGSATSTQPMAYSDAQGAQGRSFSSSSSFPSDQPSQPTAAGEAYDGKQVGASSDMSSGAYGRSFGERDMSEEQPMVSSGMRGSLSDSTRLNHFHGG